jgi:hypothetical protein
LIRERDVTSCVFCRTVLDTVKPVGRKDTCPHCNRDLRCCKQCKFYDPNAYNACREVLAQRIIDKERSNLCDYFVLRGTQGGRRSSDRVKEAKKALEALFKKK